MKKIMMMLSAAVVLTGCAPSAQTSYTIPTPAAAPTVDCTAIATRLIDRNGLLYKSDREKSIKSVKQDCEAGVIRGTNRIADYASTMTSMGESKAMTLSAYTSLGYPDAEARKNAEIRHSAQYAGFMAAIDGNTNYKTRWSCDETFSYFWSRQREAWGSVPKGEAQQFYNEWCQRGRQADIATLPDVGTGSYYSVVKRENEALKSELVGKGWTLSEAEKLTDLRMQVVSLIRRFEREKEYWPSLHASY